MAVKKQNYQKDLQKQKKESGQAMIEFLMGMPIFIGFIWYLLQVNMAINKSIVGQKHARSQLFLKLLNHSDGPESVDYDNFPKARSAFWMGIAAEPIPSGGNSDSAAPTVDLGIGPRAADTNPHPLADDEEGEAEDGVYRQRVRVRTAFGICTSRKASADGNRLMSFCGNLE